MSIKTWILDRGVAWLLESKVSPLGWVNGYKTTIGTTLEIASALLIALQTALLQAGICPGWEYCAYIDTGVAATALLIGWLTKLVGQWHSNFKKS